MMRIALATIASWGLILFLGYVVVSGLRTGKLRHSGSSTFVDRSKNAALFWALVTLFLGFIMVVMIGWLHAIAAL